MIDADADSMVDLIVSLMSVLPNPLDPLLVGLMFWTVLTLGQLIFSNTSCAIFW